MPPKERLYNIAENIVHTLLQCKETISVAESITGGLCCSIITAIPGSSKVLLEGIVPYTIRAKTLRLGISEIDLQTYGVISSFTAKAMAQNVKKTMNADYGISFTGNAGPGVNQAGSEVGTVYIGISTPNGRIVCKHCKFSSTLPREDIKYQAVLTGIEFLWDQIKKTIK